MEIPESAGHCILESDLMMLKNRQGGVDKLAKKSTQPGQAGGRRHDKKDTAMTCLLRSNSFKQRKRKVEGNVADWVCLSSELV